jgi:transcriptional regulator with XRE-family HTH domain
MKFSERLAELRKKHKMTQQELANKLGVSRGTIGMYEIGQREPDAETLKKIADFFNTTTDYLLGRTDDPNPPEKTIDDEIMSIMREMGPDVAIMFYDLKGMTDDEKENLKIFLQGLKARREKQGKEKKEEE